MEDPSRGNVVLKWDAALCERCHLVDTEVHYKDVMYQGAFVSVSKVSCEESMFVLKLASVKQIYPSPCEGEVLECKEFVLSECYSPVRITDAWYDCLHFAYKEGHLAIYFKRPSEDKK